MFFANFENTEITTYISWNSFMTLLKKDCLTEDNFHSDASFFFKVPMYSLTSYDSTCFLCVTVQPHSKCINTCFFSGGHHDCHWPH